MMKNLAILLFDDVEVLDFAGPFEVFSVANELHGYGLFNVMTISQQSTPITAVNGLTVVPKLSFEQSPEQIDYLVLPGGDGTKVVSKEPAYLKWIENAYQQAEKIMTVCSGTRFLAKLGLLNNVPFCTHHDVYSSILKTEPEAIPQPELRYVRSGKLLSSGGISAGIDAAFELLQEITSIEVADATAKYMEYRRAETNRGPYWR